MRTLILLLVVAGACSRSETSELAKQAAEPPAEAAEKSVEEAAPEQPLEPPPGVEAPVDLDAPPKVDLLDAGKPPRKELRMAFEAGAKQTLQVKSDWLVTLAYGPLIATKSTKPSFVYQLETKAREITADTARFDFRVAQVAVKSRKEVKPRELAAAQKAAKALEGAQGSFSISPRGIVEDFAVKTPSDDSLLVHDMISQIERGVRLASLPLPQEPVGKGAKWTATQTIEQRTARIRQTSTFELLGVDGQQIRATIKRDAETPMQQIKMPGSPPDRKPLRLDELDFEGQGNGTWRLDRLGPGTASEKTFTIFKMLATTPKREVTVMRIDNTIEVKTTR